MNRSKLELLVPPPIVALVTALLIYAVTRLLPDSLHIPGDRWLGYVFGLLGVATAVIAAVQFRKARTTIHPQNPQHTTTLITTGVYRLSRNPMYLGMLLVLCGWVLYLGNLVSVICLPFFVIYMNRFQVGPEEKIIAEKFGDAFERYRSRIRRWI